MRIAVIITCYNRKNKTVKCIECLKKQFDKSDIVYDIHLTDDGCTDGTSEAVKEIFPNVFIYKGENLYWAGGMRLAWKGAYEKGGYDYFMFLNDDTFVNDNLVEDFYECCLYDSNPTIITGACYDSKSGKRTYTGSIIKNIFFQRSRIVDVMGYPQYIDLSGANAMFIPKEIVDNVGFFPSVYVHGLADFDYCMRCKKLGYRHLMTSRYVASCEMNHGIQVNSLRTIKDRYRFIVSYKGLNLYQWLYYNYCFFPYRIPFIIIKNLFFLLFGVLKNNNCRRQYEK